MKMLARLHYLFAEGFEVSSLSGYDDASGEGNAKVVYVEKDENGDTRVRSEIFDVDSKEMEQCSTLFMKRLSEARE